MKNNPVIVTFAAAKIPKDNLKGGIILVHGFKEFSLSSQGGSGGVKQFTYLGPRS